MNKHNNQITSNTREPWMKHFKGPRDRVYRTGDVGRLRADGSIECLGRIDSQVKIRGFKIELGEIDAHLSQHPFVRENITVIQRDKDEEQNSRRIFCSRNKAVATIPSRTWKWPKPQARYHR